MTDQPPTSITLRANGTDADAEGVGARPAIELELLSTGASVRRLVIHDAAGATDVVLGHADPARYRDGGYLGAIVGRVANRLDGGRLPVAGTEYRLPINDGPNSLHGGPDGYDLREWEIAESTHEKVTFRLVSPDGDQGYPGDVDLEVSYRVAPGRVTIDYRASAAAPTMLNVTNHAYFNLDGEASGSIAEHELTVDAESFTPTRADQIPTGEIRAVADTPYDFRRSAPVGPALTGTDEQVVVAGGIDHNFIVSGNGFRRAAHLVGAGGRQLEVWSDLPGVQVYTGVHFDGTLTGLSGAAYERHAGIALETQGFPDAPNQPGFPSIELAPGSDFVSRTEWRLTGI